MNFELRNITIGILCLISSMAALATDTVEVEAAYGSCLPESKICIVRQMLDRTEKKVHLELDFQLDSTYLKNMTWVSLTPVIRHDTLEKVLHPMLVMGKTQSWIFDREGVDERYGENYQIVLRKERSRKQQVETWKEAFDREPWMDSAKVYVRMENCGCGKIKGTEEVAVRSFSNPDPLMMVAYLDPEHKHEPADTIKEYDISGSAFVNFVVDRWEVRPSYMQNEREIKKITDTLDIVMADKNITVRSIQIHGWASPEDTYRHNTMLATNRAASLTDYIRSLYSSLDANVFLPAKATPENWIGLVEALQTQGSEIGHASEILAMIGDPTKVSGTAADELEMRIKKTYRADYTYMLHHWYPSLRRSDYEIRFVVRPFTTEEAADVMKDNPYQLSLAEMERVAATHEKFSEEYNEVVKTIYAFYGRDHEEARIYRANVALRCGELELAETILRDCGDNAPAWNARGIAALCRAQWNEAREAFQKAAELGADETHNLQVVDTLEAHPANQ